MSCTGGPRTRASVGLLCCDMTRQWGKYRGLGYKESLRVGSLLPWGLIQLNSNWASLVAPKVKNLPSMWETWIRSLVGKIPWRRAWQLTSVFLPGKSQGQRSMAGNSPWGRKESDTTDWLSLQNSNSCGLSVQSQEYDKVGMGSPWDQKSFLSRESLCGWSWAC